jgi:hypothetical protein
VSPAAAPAPIASGFKPGDSTVTIAGQKISWDAVLVAGAGLLGILLLWRLNKGSGASIAFGQSPQAADSTQQLSGTPLSSFWSSPNPSLPGGGVAAPQGGTAPRAPANASASILSMASAPGSTVPMTSASTAGPPPGPGPGSGAAPAWAPGWTGNTGVAAAAAGMSGSLAGPPAVVAPSVQYAPQPATVQAFAPIAPFLGGLLPGVLTPAPPPVPATPDPPPPPGLQPIAAAAGGNSFLTP